jgi:hypothetical protein
VEVITDEIKRWLDSMGIENYTIHPDGTVDVDGDVNISDKNLISIPIQFGTVTGIFTCACNRLTSLTGSPRKVGGDYFCSDNQLTSLRGSPREVGGNFWCDYNQLSSLFGSPSIIGGNFVCSNNQLGSRKGGPRTVGGRVYCHQNKFNAEPSYPALSFRDHRPPFSHLDK